MRALQYALEEAAASLWRGRQAVLLSTATIATAMVVLGGFLIVTMNLDRVADDWSRAAGVSVYLDDGVTPADRAAVERMLAPGDVVTGFEFVSKAEALKRFKETFTDLASTIDTLDPNPLPASYEVRLRPDSAGRAAVDRLGALLRQTPGVSDVRYDRDWIGRLLSAIGIVRGLGLALSAVLGVAAALTVANVVRLALFARRDELAIMELIGAPKIYIRGPFVMEGVLQGGLGAIFALVVLLVAYFSLRSRVLLPLASAFGASSVRFLNPGLCTLLVAGGMAVGCVGGLVAALTRRSA
jgi:cell division transport system permease protein